MSSLPSGVGRIVLHTAASVQSFFELSITEYNHPAKIFQKSVTGYTMSIFLSGLIASFVQVYFANRARIVTGRWWFSITCWILSFLRFMGTIGLTAVLSTLTLDDFFENYEWLAVTVWTIGVVVDIMISVYLTWSIIKGKRDAIQIRRVLDYVIAATIQTGIATSLTTITIMVSFIVWPKRFIWAAAGAALAKMFSISLFSSLNARERLRSEAMFDQPTIRFADVEGSSQPELIVTYRQRERPFRMDAHSQVQSTMGEAASPTTPSTANASTNVSAAASNDRVNRKANDSEA